MLPEAVEPAGWMASRQRSVRGRAFWPHPERTRVLPDSLKTNRPEGSQHRLRRKGSTHTCPRLLRRILACHRDISEAIRDRSTKPHRSKTWHSPVPTTRESAADRSSASSAWTRKERKQIACVPQSSARDDPRVKSMT